MGKLSIVLSSLPECPISMNETGGGELACVVSHRFAKNKAKGWGTGVLLLLSVLIAPLAVVAAPAGTASPGAGWQTKVDHDLPLLGHRNWILIVDSAYPLQSSPGVETVATNAGQIEVVKYVLGAINNSIHVRPDIFMDAELPYVQEEDAPGTSAYRDAIAKVLEGQDVQSALHEQLIQNVDEAGKLVNVLVLKTKLAVPYSSVFIRLNCKYWADDAEERLRAKMPAAETPQQPAPEPTAPPVPQPTPEQPAPPPAQPGQEQNPPAPPPPNR
jgi:RbsD / FucU transport protein family